MDVFTRSDSPRTRLAQHTSSAIREVMLAVAGNPETLLEVVAGGPMRWRNQFLHSCRGLAVDQSVADHLFAFFSRRVVHQFGDCPVSTVLDGLEVYRPPTQREINDAWEVESFSSEEGRRYFYGVDGHPEQIIHQLVH